jgi:MscS family membrane protein
MEIVKAAGTDFAFPSRTVYMQAVDAPEPFVLPERSADVGRMAELKQQSVPGAASWGEESEG